MAWCEDKAVGYLNRYGYNVLKLPRAGIEPLDVIGDDRHVEKLGTVADFWGDDVSLPKPGVPQPTALSSGIESDELDLKLGLNLLGNALAGLSVSGLNTAKLEVGYQSAQKIVLKIPNPSSISVNPYELGSYLRGRVLDWSHPLVTQYFSNDDCDVYIITEVLKAQELSVAAATTREGGLDVNVSLIEGAVSGQVTVKPVKEESAAELRYTGSVPITFGFKCFSVQYKNGAWQMRDVKPSEDLSFVPGEQEPQTALLRPGRLVRLGT